MAECGNKSGRLISPVPEEHTDKATVRVVRLWQGTGRGYDEHILCRACADALAGYYRIMGIDYTYYSFD